MTGAPPNPPRNFPRVPLSVEVSLESEHNFYTGITDNISEGGLFVATTNAPPEGTEVSFELVLGDQRFQVHGEVRWVRSRHLATADAPEGCGIRWTNLPSDALAAIQRFARSRDTLFYDE